MIVAKVVGNVWATRKHTSLTGHKLLLVKQIEPLTGAFIGATMMAVDGGVDAGPGDTVLMLDEGGSARKVLKDDEAPVRALICGVVDAASNSKQVKKYA